MIPHKVANGWSEFLAVSKIQTNDLSLRPLRALAKRARKKVLTFAESDLKSDPRGRGNSHGGDDQEGRIRCVE